nr:immunoglobulin heavy chain junction region [Macaca mulatta]MOW20828.1 immunoglobulin heavy chain junction region [Macaca mulatta]
CAKEEGSISFGNNRFDVW